MNASECLRIAENFEGCQADVRRRSTHQSDRVIREIPRARTQAHRPALEDLLSGRRDLDRAIDRAYSRFGYRMREIAQPPGVHYATVSRRIRRMESRDV